MGNGYVYMAHEHSLLRHLLIRGRQHRPLIGGHRGASARAPENTLPSFALALEDGAEMIELDVHLTRDGQLAVIHDEMTERTTGMVGAVAELTMPQLRGLDAGAHKGEQWNGEPIPELGDVFALVREHARGLVLVNVEIKGGADAAPVLLERIAAHDMAERVIISSFDPATVRAATERSTEVLGGLLVQQPAPDLVALARGVGASLVHVKHTYIDDGLVEMAHADGLGVLAWTVNRPDEMRRLAALGVDAILSDDPHTLRETIGASDSDIEGI